MKGQLDALALPSAPSPVDPFDHDPRGDRIYTDHSLQCWCGVHTECANSRRRCICHSTCYGCRKVEELSNEQPKRRKRK